MTFTAFFIRDLQIALSYKLQFLMQFASIFFSSVMLFFLSKLVGSGIANQLAPYGGDYFSFVIIGIALTDYLGVSLGAFSSRIRTAQVQGTLEALLVTPTSIPTILFSSTLYDFTFTSLRIFLYLILGALFFGLQLHLTHLLSLVWILILTILAFSGIGLISATFIIIFKQGSPVNFLITTFSGLLGGVIYPVSILPDWLKPISWLLPITHALEAMRKILLTGAGFSDVTSSMAILAVFVVVLLPLGFFMFGYGLNIAKKEGSLIHF